jgi:alpha-galactosidase
VVKERSLQKEIVVYKGYFMNKSYQIGMCLLLWTMSFRPADAVSPPSPDEMSQARQWAAAHFEGISETKPAAPWFSFLYDGKPSAEFLPTWDFKRTSRRLDAGRTEYTLVYSDPKTGLSIRCVGVENRRFPTVEWTLYFKNDGKKNTPLLADILALDAILTPKDADHVLLHHFRGDNCTKDSFQPFLTPLTPGIDRRFVPAGGRPSTGEWPYYNIAWNNGGAILAVGWPGQWACQFTRKAGEGVRIRAGQELTHFTLHPGEEIRTPLIALMFYRRDWIDAQNLWRRWMLVENFPKDHGKTVSPKFAGFCGNYFDDYRTNQKGEIQFIDRYIQEGLKPDYWWMDTGWYPLQRDWGQDTGTWEVDKKRYPQGIRAIAEHAHANGMQLILWFEPERAAADTWLTKNHPEWILGGKNGGVLNLGNPDAWKWTVERIDSLIASEKVDVYRQDYNIDPLGYWRGNDSADRQGITENKYVRGYLAFWDELRRRHPGMLIDSCASGGRRDDLETMRRALPFLRSDYCTDPEGMQCHTYAFSLWLPYYRGSTDKINSYDFHSNLAPLIMTAWDMRKKDLDYPTARKLIEQWRQIAPCFLGDFYPLTDYSIADNDWMAFQFNGAEGSKGIVQAFRRAKCPRDSIRVKLQGLEPKAVYVVANLDVPGTAPMTGRELSENGLVIAVKNQPGSAVITYKKK